MPAYTDPAFAAANETHIHINTITVSDVVDALSEGASDFWRHPSHYLFVALIYPAVGIVIAVWSAGAVTFPLLYPLAIGFALVGPIAVIGLYELSRRREDGEDDNPRYALDIIHHPAIGSMVVIGAFLAILFAFWIAAAGALYSFYFAPQPAEHLSALLRDIFTTPHGWSLLMWGNLVGVGFALVVLATTSIAFPLLVDKGGSPGRAIGASLRAFAANPVPLLAWGLIVIALLVVGSLPLFVGLAIVLPILGHATWHLYRKIAD